MKKQSAIVPILQNQSWIKFISQRLRQIITKNKDSSKQVEVEFKYAHSSIHAHYQGEYFIFQRLSHQFPILMNNAGIGYKFVSGFPDLKKFYFIRDYLKNLALANERSSNEGRNYYKNLANQLQNSKIKFKENQLRIDVNNEQTKDRYTYTFQKGWQKMKKSKINEPFDLLYCERQIRMTINEQKKQWNSNYCDEIKQLLQQKRDKVLLRIKNIVKYQKDQKFQIALSEVIKVKQNKAQTFNQLSQCCQYASQMDNFLINEFANFYDHPFDWQTRSLQIQSQITPYGYQLLKKYHNQNRSIQFQSLIQIMLQDLASLFHADYSIKIEQLKVMENMLKSKNHLNKNQKVNIVSRLQNLIGGYMRQQIDKFMNS